MGLVYKYKSEDLENEVSILNLLWQMYLFTDTQYYQTNFVFGKHDKDS